MPFFQIAIVLKLWSTSGVTVAYNTNIYNHIQISVILKSDLSVQGLDFKLSQVRVSLKNLEILLLLLIFNSIVAFWNSCLIP